jgi:hypothetical protein
VHFVRNVWNEAVIDTFKCGSFVGQKHRHGWVISCCPEVFMKQPVGSVTQLIILLNCCLLVWFLWCLSYEILKGRT